MVATGSSIDEVREGGWLLFGPSETAQPWQPWAFQRARRRRLALRARIVGRDRDRGVRRHVRDPVQHQRHRARLGPGPRHEPGDARRRGPERRVGGARWDPRLSRAQPHGARGAHARGRAGGGARRGARSSGRRRVGRVGRRADPEDDRRGRAGVPRSRLHRRVGLGQAAIAAAGANTAWCS